MARQGSVAWLRWPTEGSILSQAAFAGEIVLTQRRLVPTLPRPMLSDGRAPFAGARHPESGLLQTEACMTIKLRVPFIFKGLSLVAALALALAACNKFPTTQGATASGKLEAPAVGSASPKVDILAFVDYECPFSRSTAQPLLDVVTKHKDDVRLRYFNLPLDVHPNSVTAAKGAVAAAKQNAFDKYYSKFMADTVPTKDAIIAWAVTAGLDAKRLAADLDSPETEQIVKRDAGLAKVLGISGTPSYVVNGELMMGKQEPAIWEKRIKDEIGRADGILAAGAQREGLVLALAKARNSKLVADYERYVIKGENPPPVAIPVPIPRSSGVASAQIQAAGAAGGAVQVGEPVQVGQESADTKTVWRVALRADDPAQGSAKAPVTVVVFADMECPFCAKLEPTLLKLRQKYGDNLRMVFKHNPLPLHSHAAAAAEALESSRQQGKFWEMHDYLLAHQDKLDTDGLRTAAKAIGLKLDAHDTAMAAHAGRDRIDADVEQGAALGMRGTPNLFVNGRKLVGAKEESVISALIDDELKHAQALIKAGTAADGVYEAIVSKGKLLDSLATEERKFDLSSAAVRGPAGAVIEIVAFEDFQCPFSARLDPHVQEIEKEFEGRVRVAWLDFPLRDIHPQAQNFAEAGQEALKQGKFWQFHAAVMADNANLDDAKLHAAAKKAGLDVKALDAALKDHKWAQAVDKQRKLGEEAAVKGTPSVFINGHAFVPQTGFSATTFRAAVRRLLGTR